MGELAGPSRRMGRRRSPRMIPVVPDVAAARSLARRLEALQPTLTPDEQQILRALVFAAADPIARIGMRDPGEVLSPEEADLLNVMLSRRVVGSETGARNSVAE